MKPLNKQELINLVYKAQNGDQPALEHLYSVTRQAQFFTALTILKDGQMAEDAVQSAYMRVVEYLPKLTKPGNFMAWLNQITYHCCMDIAKNHEKTVPVTDEDLILRLPDEDEGSNPLNNVIKKEGADTLLAYIGRLSDEQRTVIIMRYYQDLKIREIAKILDCSEGTVKSRLHYAHKLLKTEFRKAGYSGKTRPLFLGTMLRSSYQKNAPELPVKRRKASSYGFWAAVIASGTLLISAAVFISGSGIERIRISDTKDYTNKPINIEIKARLNKDCSLKVSYENGEALDVQETEKGLFSTAVSRNGRLNVSLFQKDKELERRSFQIDTIDISPPEMKKHVLKGSKMYVTLRDDLSGIDYKSLLVISAGSPRNVNIENTKKGIISFSCKQKDDILIYASDRCGNLVKYHIQSKLNSYY